MQEMLQDMLSIDQFWKICVLLTFLQTTGGRNMEKKRQKKWTIVKIIVIMAFLFSVAGTNVASAAGYINPAIK